MKKLWTYYVREAERHGATGRFMLSSNGLFAAITEFGNYSHQWPVTGFHQEDFRIEILRMEKCYVLQKCFYHQKKEYSGEQSLRDVKETLLKHRRDNGMTKEDARDEWTLLKACNFIETSHDFSIWYDQTSLDDPGEYHRMDYPNDAKRFIERLFPLLKEAIRKEIAKERFLEEMCA